MSQTDVVRSAEGIPGYQGTRGSGNRAAPEIDGTVGVGTVAEPRSKRDRGTPDPKRVPRGWVDDFRIEGRIPGW